MKTLVERTMSGFEANLEDLVRDGPKSQPTVLRPSNELELPVICIPTASATSECIDHAAHRY